MLKETNSYFVSSVFEYIAVKLTKITLTLKKPYRFVGLLRLDKVKGIMLDPTSHYLTKQFLVIISSVSQSCSDTWWHYLKIIDLKN